MTELTALVALLIVTVGGLVSIAVWAPRRVAPKLAALAGGTVALAIGTAAAFTLLSLPKPVDLEWWQDHADEATVLGHTMREGEAIWLWLALDGVPEPRSYVLPWQRELAEQLESAARDAARDGTGVRMRLPFEPSLDDREPKVYALPQPALPPKDADEPAEVFVPEEDA